MLAVIIIKKLRVFYLLGLSLLSLQLIHLLLIAPPRPCFSCFPGGQLVRRRPRREPPLMLDEHVPNVAEDSAVASGRPGMYIRPNHTRYFQLVDNFNPLIVFRSKVDGNVSRKMSARCKEKVDTLAMLINTQWPGLKLRVVRGWVEKNQAIRYPTTSESLHYEARAVDLTTSDMDQTKYGMLARLAVQAGFDWVYYEHKSHVHASVKSDVSTRKNGPFQCFPASATVLTDNGRRKSVSDLRTGENLLAYSPETGRFVYSPFIAHLHIADSSAEPKRHPFLQICTENGTTLTVSQGHLIFVSSTIRPMEDFVKNQQQKQQHQNFRIIFAEKVEIGDFLLIRRKNDSKNDDDYFQLEKVYNISMVHRPGLYAPLTVEGTIVVDDVIVSCYAAIDDHWLAHKAMAPLRLWEYAKTWWWSWSRDFFHSPESKNATKVKVVANSGVRVHWYANFLWSLADIIESLHLYNFWDA